MKTTIILSHPWHGSFNKAIMDSVVNQLEQAKKAYQVIDLNKVAFNPVLEEKDLALFSKGETTDPMVQKYQHMLMETDELVFIFPVWWFGIPAILKGFFDKVMLKDFAYIEGKTGLKGLLTHIKRTTVITTSELPTWYLILFSGNPIKGTFIRSTLRGIGLKKVKWLNSGMTSSGKKITRTNFLHKVKMRFSTTPLL